MHHDEHLLELIIDDLAPTQHLLELLKEESLALYGRDMRLLEEILARKHRVQPTEVAALQQRPAPGFWTLKTQGQPCTTTKPCFN